VTAPADKKTLRADKPMRVLPNRKGATPPGLRTLVIACALFGAALLALLSQATANTTLLARHYPLLLGVGGALALGLMVLIGYQLWLLRRKLKAGVFGSKLTLRLLLIFALMALVPGGLVYAVSVQFIQKSIESWFDVKVDRALEGGLNFGRNVLDNLLRDLDDQARGMSAVLSDAKPGEEAKLLNRLREQVRVEEAALISLNGKVVAFSGNEKSGLLPELPSSSTLRQVRTQQGVRSIESIPERGLYLRALVAVSPASLTGEVRVLQVLQPVPPAIAKNAELVEEGRRDYQELTVARVGLQRIFALALTLAMLITLLIAIALALLLSEKFSRQLGLLAESARAVGDWDFSRMNPVRSHDELGALTQSFNTMTRRLADASALMEQNKQELQNAKTYLESILGNLSAGVMAFDDRMHLRTVNAAAEHILDVQLPATNHTGVALSEWVERYPALKPLAVDVARRFGEAPDKVWENQMEIAGATGIKTLLVRGSRLPENAGGGYVVVFDDITHLLQAQRDAAWGEVARRLAHEIKNPLTPIQLSAERLEHKLQGKLPDAEADMLKRSTATIVNQVAALKSMVDDFSEYAKAARLRAEPVSLNSLTREVLVLYESMGVRILAELEPALPKIRGDVTMLRQVMNNLMQNAIDALAGAENPQIVVKTELDGNGVRLSIRDNGSGFEEGLLTRVFEPYVTTKPKGTGLGLAIVKKIVDEHHGQVQVSNVLPHGANVSIVLPLAEAA
jgi:nitrogen fixation/metabolism regulation signal transduction histidine kinase